MATSYDKFAKLEDSDDETVERKEYQVRTVDDLSSRQQQQASIDTWLKRRMVKLKVAAASLQEQEDDWIYGSHPRWIEKQMTVKSSGESILFDHRPLRDLSTEERGALAMLMAMGHFEEGSTNLHLHFELRNHVGMHPWLEEPSIIDLLCRIHASVLHEVREAGINAMEASPENEMRKKLVSALNVLAAPGLAKCSGGLREFMPRICTNDPSGEAKAWKEKYHRQDFGKEAIVQSLCADLGSQTEERNALCWLVFYAAVIVLLLVLTVVAGYYLIIRPHVVGDSAAHSPSSGTVGGHDTESTEL
mmetsp:Transcript_62388/g.115808  ORF Transcript_62388/g.115808 Transcript_62388/m.115808 type:complete len:304 (+) Transcript_62388:49-960(+)